MFVGWLGINIIGPTTDVTYPHCFTATPLQPRLDNIELHSTYPTVGTIHTYHNGVSPDLIMVLPYLNLDM